MHFSTLYGLCVMFNIMIKNRNPDVELREISREFNIIQAQEALEEKK